MAQKKVVWTASAIQDQIDIFRYWSEHNQSDHFSKKLEQLFTQAASLIAAFPNIGVPTDIQGVRVKIVRAFKLFYVTTDESVIIIRVWDGRQDPERIVF
jgi:plasmid stabilization system protein ParE